MILERPVGSEVYYKLKINSLKGIIMAKRLCKSPSNTEKAKFLSIDKKDDDETNSKSIGFFEIDAIISIRPK